MADTSVSDFAFLINRQVNSREELTICLAKLGALITLGKNCDLSELTVTIVNEYFWVLGDYINQAIKFNDDGLDLLLKRKIGDQIV